MPFSALSRVDLTAVEEENLVRIVRATSSTTHTHADGTTYTVFHPTPSEDDALTTLLAAYSSDIRRAAKTARVIDVEDAEMVAVEKFISLARKDSGRQNERLAGFVSRAMVNAIMNADAEASAIRIPPDTLRRYFNLVRDCGSVEEAYAACRDASNNFDPLTLLAVHRALNAESIETITSSDNDGSARTNSTWGAKAVNEGSAIPGPEESVVQAELIKYLFTLTSYDAEEILRLAYGFTDETSQTLRVRAGYPQDACLSDAQISPVVSRSRASVQRTRVDALRVMHTAVVAAAQV